jgi:hypothetical protein
MALIAQRSLEQLQDLNTSFWNEVSQNPNVPQSVKSMIRQHVMSFWISDALAVIISPLKQGQDSFLKNSVFDLSGIQYYYPSLEFWMDHSQRAHSPAGQGCNPEAHAAYLTRGGSAAQYIYAVVKKDGSLLVEDLNGFINECAFYLSGTN